MLHAAKCVLVGLPLAITTLLLRHSPTQRGTSAVSSQQPPPPTWPLGSCRLARSRLFQRLQRPLASLGSLTNIPANVRRALRSCHRQSTAAPLDRPICTILRVATLVLPLFVASCNLGHGQFRKATVLAPPVGMCQAGVFHEDGSVRPEHTEYALIQDICGDIRTPTDADHSRNNIPHSSNLLSFAIVEFNDSGTYWDRDQFTNVKQEITRIAKAQQSSSVHGQGIFLVMFVHGWRHNASEGSSNLRHFRQFAQDLASSSSICNAPDQKGKRCSKQNKPHVLAVYLGWRGDSTGATSHFAKNLGPLRALLKGLQLPTFWHRKSAARTAAGIAMTETILGILAELDKSDRSRRLSRLSGAEAPVQFYKSRTVLIGHSFGARALELAVAQAYLGHHAQSLQLFEEQIGGDGTLTRLLDDLDDQLATSQRQLDEIRHQMRDAERQGEADRIEINELRAKVELLRREQNKRRSDLEHGLSTLEDHRGFGVTTLGSFLGPCLSYDEAAVDQCATDGKDDQRPSRAGSLPLQRATCSLRRAQCLEETIVATIDSWRTEWIEANAESTDLPNEEALACDDALTNSIPPTRVSKDLDLHEGDQVNVDDIEDWAVILMLSEGTLGHLYAYSP